MRSNEKFFVFLAIVVGLIWLITSSRIGSDTDKKKPGEPFKVNNGYDWLLKKEAKKRDIDWRFVKAILIKESHCKEDAISYAGAVGLMQLMPREGSYKSKNYKNYLAARKKAKDKNGNRWYDGKSSTQWRKAYVAELKWLASKYKNSKRALYKKDTRFDPEWNIKEGVRQYSSDYKYFLKRGHNAYRSRLLAAASYNAGRGGVVRLKGNAKYDAIPINQQTEMYTITVLRIYEALKRGGGKVQKRDWWVLRQ